MLNPANRYITMSQKPRLGYFSILYFASAATFTQKSSEDIPAPLAASNLFDYLDQKYPGFKSKILTSCAFTVNLRYIDMDESSQPQLHIQEGDEVAIIPPVSSG